MGAKLGHECKLYYGAAGSTATTELTIVKEVRLTGSRTKVNVTKRANAGFLAWKFGLRDAGVEFDLQYDSADPGYEFIRAAWMSGTVIALAILDGPNGKGLDADFEIGDFNRNEPLDGEVTVTVTAAPTDVNRPPTWKNA